MTVDEAHIEIHEAVTKYLSSRHMLFMDDNHEPQVVINDAEKVQAIDDIYDNKLREIFRSLSYEDQIHISIMYDKEVFNLMLNEEQRMICQLIK